MNGPNSSPIHNVPSGVRCTDSMSESPPVSRRSAVSSLTISKPIRLSGSRSEMNSSTTISPEPPSALSHSGVTWYRRNSKSTELSIVPNPLSGIAHIEPSSLTTTPENPGITCPGYGGVRPLAGSDNDPVATSSAR
jgi:hypothetical protein